MKCLKGKKKFISKNLKIFKKSYATLIIGEEI